MKKIFFSILAILCLNSFAFANSHEEGKGLNINFKVGKNSIEGMLKDLNCETNCEEKNQEAVSSGILTNEELEFITNSFSFCHYMPTNIEVPKDTYIKISASYNMNSEVIKESIELISTNLNENSDHYTSLIGHAKRSFLHPDCTTLFLPLDKWDNWKTIIMNSDYSLLSEE